MYKMNSAQRALVAIVVDTINKERESRNQPILTIDEYLDSKMASIIDQICQQAKALLKDMPPEQIAPMKKKKWWPFS